MAASLFERTLTTAEMEAVFDDRALVGAMLELEAALADAEGAESVIPAAAAQAIGAACGSEDFDIEAIVVAARQAGTIVVPLVEQLKARVRQGDSGAAAFVHRGSTSQDAIDSAMVLATRAPWRFLRPISTVSSIRFLRWPERTRRRPCSGARSCSRRRSSVSASSSSPVSGLPCLARGTCSAMPGSRSAAKSPCCAARSARSAAIWRCCHRARSARWPNPVVPGRGTSSAMPHKRNPVAALDAIAAASRGPQFAATLLATMAQERERGLGNWQAELAQRPALFMSAHGALRALANACAGLEVDTARMRGNFEAHLRAVAAVDANAAPVDVDAEARHAGALAEVQLDALQRQREEPFK